MVVCVFFFCANKYKRVEEVTEERSLPIRTKPWQIHEILTYFLNVKYKNSVAMWDPFWDTEELKILWEREGRQSQHEQSSGA